MYRNIHFSMSGCLFLAAISTAQTFHPQIPKAWDDRDVASFEVPLADPDRSARYLNAAEYYALEVAPIYRTYPVYAPGKGPARYLDSLKEKAPEVVFDPAKLRTEQDWIRAGELVFDSPTRIAPPDRVNIIKPEFLRDVPLNLTREGVIPYIRYVVRKQGVVELGVQSCGFCHSRVLPDGTVLKGAQGNFPGEQRNAWVLRQQADNPERDRRARLDEWAAFAAPWVRNPDELYGATAAEAIRRRGAMQPGVFAREGSSSAYPVHIPSLIGIHDIRYLDATGLTRHRSIADLMRYAIVNRGGGNGLQSIARFGDFHREYVKLLRYSDEQLYALALFIYSLQPPPNPNPFDENALRGQRIFQQQGCAGCHTPPLYTNNKLTPAPGFQIPSQLRKIDDILDVSVGTDPSSATRSRRGTGFYKVPSLRGVWCRNAFGHNGQAETLEEWFDPARLRKDYVPKGFHLGPGPIQGHEFGTKLGVDDRQALIAFLKTL